VRHQARNCSLFCTTLWIYYVCNLLCFIDWMRTTELSAQAHAHGPSRAEKVQFGNAAQLLHDVAPKAPSEESLLNPKNSYTVTFQITRYLWDAPPSHPRLLTETEPSAFHQRCHAVALFANDAEISLAGHAWPSTLWTRCTRRVPAGKHILNCVFDLVFLLAVSSTGKLNC
jgi:hypothetical protein